VAYIELSVLSMQGVFESIGRLQRLAIQKSGRLATLDPQLICYSWISGISDVAVVVFVRKQLPEIQYLKASISEEQRREFGRLVETTITGRSRSVLP